MYVHTVQFARSELFPILGAGLEGCSLIGPELI